MIVTVLAIVAFVAFRAINRDDLDVKPVAVDYLQTVTALQEGKELEPVYPPKLPKGWIATRAVYSADHLAWELDVLTDKGKYLGLREAAMSEQELITTYVDEKGKRTSTVTLDGAVTPEWQRWDVDAEDTAVTAKLGDDHLLVFGSAGRAVVEKYAASLVVG